MHPILALLVKDGLMFFPLNTDTQANITFIFDNQKIKAHDGMTIAAALLQAGYKSFRLTPVSGKERGPFCMMGACFDCLVQIKGESVQACMVQVRSGLQVSRVPRPNDQTETDK